MNVLTFPDLISRIWRPVGEAVRQGALQRTGSATIAATVESRCRAAFESCVPLSLDVPGTITEEQQERISAHIHGIIGRFIAVLALEMEAVALLERRPVKR